jgi:hypothetical protein
MYIELGPSFRGCYSSRTGTTLLTPSSQRVSLTRQSCSTAANLSSPLLAGITRLVSDQSGFEGNSYFPPITLGTYPVTVVNGSLQAVAMVTVLDPALAPKFTATSVCSPRSQDFSITELPNSNILMVGGDLGNAVNELYRPATNDWQPAAASIQGRYQQGAVMVTAGVNAGKILVCGGFLQNTGATLNTCELYDPGLIHGAPGQLCTQRVATLE